MNDSMLNLTLKLRQAGQGAVSIVATKGAEGHRTKEELHKLIDLLPDDKEWGYSLVLATKKEDE